MASALKLQPYKKGIHIRFAPSKEQLQEVIGIAKEFAASIS
jgi:hypothetical protein